MTDIIKNLTKHPITILGAENETLRVIEPSGVEVRLTQSVVQGEPIDGLPTSFTVYGEAENLPDEQEGTFYIVSQLIKNAPTLRERKDLLVPADMVRETTEDGKTIIRGCKSLGR
jgi:hypothetical protein